MKIYEEREISIKEGAKIRIVVTDKEITIEDRDRFGELRREVWFRYSEFNAILKELEDAGIIRNGRIVKMSADQ